MSYCIKTVRAVQNEDLILRTQSFSNPETSVASTANKILFVQIGVLKSSACKVQEIDCCPQCFS